jgi:solute carrier family 35 (adenosine 3'-phospho 5'-phosphosulfate transporter), member B2
MTISFGPSRELFSSSLFIVFCNRLMTSAVSVLVLMMQSGPVTPVAPIHSYAAVSFANLVASTCQYDSLKYISFALQTLAKCCKMLPVMVWGVIIRKKRYPAAEVATAALVTAGCAAFIFSGNILARRADESVSVRYYAYGILLLLLYLCFDGFASTWQDSLFAGYEMDTSNQVLYTTLCSTAISFVVLLCSQEMFDALRFVHRHPHAVVYITAVSSVATIIQYFVAYTIKTYGALNFATLMTARQFFSVIASSVIFQHRFSHGQWCVTAIEIPFLTSLCCGYVDVRGGHAHAGRYSCSCRILNSWFKVVFALFQMQPSQSGWRLHK